MLIGHKQDIIDFFINTKFPCETEFKEVDNIKNKGICEFLSCPLCLKETDSSSPSGIKTSRELKLCIALARVLKNNGNGNDNGDGSKPPH